MIHSRSSSEPFAGACTRGTAQRTPQPPKHEQPWPSDHGKKGGHESYPYPPRGPGDWRDPPYTGTYFPPYPRDDPPPRTYPPPDNDYPPHETEPPPPQPEVPRSTYVQVPNVVGMSIVAARGAIFDRGLNPQYGGEQPDGSPPDKVATTSPRAFKALTRSSFCSGITRAKILTEAIWRRSSSSISRSLWRRGSSGCVRRSCSPKARLRARMLRCRRKPRASTGRRNQRLCSAEVNGGTGHCGGYSVGG